MASWGGGVLRWSRVKDRLYWVINEKSSTMAAPFCGLDSSFFCMETVKQVIQRADGVFFQCLKIMYVVVV